MRHYPASARTVAVTTNAVNPVQVAASRMLDFAQSLGMNGRSNGLVRIGEPSSPTMHFSGELGPLQMFRGASPQAVTRGLRMTPNVALPNAGGVVRAGGSLLDPMADSQLGT